MLCGLKCPPWTGPDRGIGCGHGRVCGGSAAVVGRGGAAFAVRTPAGVAALLLGQGQVPGSEEVGGGLGLAVPSEDALPVAPRPVQLLPGHEVGEVPDQLPEQDALGPEGVERAEVLQHQLCKLEFTKVVPSFFYLTTGLVLLREDGRGHLVELCDGVGAVLRDQDGLAVLLPPGAQVAGQVGLDQLQVAQVRVPGLLLVQADYVHGVGGLSKIHSGNHVQQKKAKKMAYPGRAAPRT